MPEAEDSWRLNPRINVAAVLPRRIRRTAIGDAIERQLVADYPYSIFQIIRHLVKAEEAPLKHQTLTDYAPESTTTKDYLQLAGRLDAAAAQKAGE